MPSSSEASKGEGQSTTREYTWVCACAHSVKRGARDFRKITPEIHIITGYIRLTLACSSQYINSIPDTFEALSSSQNEYRCRNLFQFSIRASVAVAWFQEDRSAGGGH